MTHDEANAQVRGIIEGALDSLTGIGLASRSAAAELLAVQAIIRIEGNKARRQIAAFAQEMLPSGGTGEAPAKGGP